MKPVQALGADVRVVTRNGRRKTSALTNENVVLITIVPVGGGYQAFVKCGSRWHHALDSIERKNRLSDLLGEDPAARTNSTEMVQTILEQVEWQIRTDLRGFPEPDRPLEPGMTDWSPLSGLGSL